jgi:hypothetical protein
MLEPERSGKKRPKDQIMLLSHRIHVEYATALPRRADFVAKGLAQLNAIFGTLLADDNFLTLLRAESITSLPMYFKPLLDRNRRDVDEVN